jgi:putative peptidoglycan lipid II flippase
VKIAIVVLLLTQALNVVLVPWLAHAGLALAIGIGAMVNALWLLMGLLRRGSYRPQAGWGVFLLQVTAASALLAVFLIWAANAWDWPRLQAQPWTRIGLLAAVVSGAATIYLGAAWAAGLRFRQFLRR